MPTDIDGDMYKFKNVFADIKSIYEEYFENGLEKYEERCKKVIAENTINEDTFCKNCKKCMKYLDYLEDNFNRDNQKKAQGMLYLYSWLYDKELYKEKYSNELNIYKNLIDKYEENGYTNLSQIFRSNVKEDHIDQLKKVYDLYYKFHKFINNKVKSNSCEIAEECVNSYMIYNNNCNDVENADFCAGVKEFEKYYISYVNEKKICHGSIIYIIFVKNRIILTIMITILITLIATFILFFRYKFTPPGLCLFTRKKDNQKLKNKINQELYNKNHTYEMSYANSNNSPYNLSYHSMETN